MALPITRRYRLNNLVVGADAGGDRDLPDQVDRSVVSRDRADGSALRRVVVGKAVTVVRPWPYVIGWIVTVWAFAPGHATGDTGAHIFEATSPSGMTTGHPLLNPITFWVSYRLGTDELGVLVTMTALLWVSLWLTALGVRRLTGYNVTIALVLLAFSPMLFNYLGLLAKDMFSAATIVLAVAALVIERTTTRRWPWLTLAAVAVYVATLYKPQIIGTTFVLLGYLAVRAVRGRDLKPIVKTVAVLAAATVGTLGTFAVEGGLIALTNANDFHKEQAIMMFDLTGMSTELGVDLMPPTMIVPARENEFLTTCYNPLEWDSVAWWGSPCSWVLDSELGYSIWWSGTIADAWRDAISAHPGAYIRQRVRHTVAFQTTPGKVPSYYFVGPTEVNSELSPNPLQGAYQYIYRAIGDTVLFWPLFWMVVMVAMLVVHSRIRRRGGGQWGELPDVLLVGALAFYPPLVLLGISYDFRYNYGSLWLLALASVLIGTELLNVDHDDADDADDGRSVSESASAEALAEPREAV